MRKSREKKPLLHVFVCNAAAYEQGELIGGWLTLPASEEAMRQVGLDPAEKKPVDQYSLGMRQRLAIAQALMEDPSLLILDEPLNGLDKNGVLHIRSLIKDLRTQGKTVILASHNQMDIDELCDTVCEMDGGILTVVR